MRDEGVGIAQSDRRRIFEKFHRGSGDITREVKGARIGLNLVQLRLAGAPFQELAGGLDDADLFGDSGRNELIQ